MAEGKKGMDGSSPAIPISSSLKPEGFFSEISFLDFRFNLFKQFIRINGLTVSLIQ